MDKLTHVDDQGRANMVDVGRKNPQRRRAIAAGSILLSEQTRELVRKNQIKKGDVLTVAKIAGIQAAKQTANLIPLCHPLLLDRIDVKLNLTEQGVTAQSDVRCVGRTGVEMEAMVAVSAALLTVYDMCKAVDKEMEITGVHLLEKVKENV